MKISANCSLVSTNFTVPIAYMIPDEMMRYLNMLSPWVLNLIFGKINGTCVITHQRNLVDLQSKVCKLLFEPQNLCTTASCSYVFSLSSRESYTCLLLAMPWDKALMKAQLLGCSWAGATFISISNSLSKLLKGRHCLMRLKTVW